MWIILVICILVDSNSQCFCWKLAKILLNRMRIASLTAKKNFINERLHFSSLLLMWRDVVHQLNILLCRVREMEVSKNYLHEFFYIRSYWCIENGQLARGQDSYQVQTEARNTNLHGLAMRSNSLLILGWVIFVDWDLYYLLKDV